MSGRNQQQQRRVEKKGGIMKEINSVARGHLDLGLSTPKGNSKKGKGNWSGGKLKISKKRNLNTKKNKKKKAHSAPKYLDFSHGDRKICKMETGIREKMR